MTERWLHILAGGEGPILATMVALSLVLYARVAASAFAIALEEIRRRRKDRSEPGTPPGADEGTAAIRAAIDARLARSRARWSRGFTTIRALCGILPMLGLLGTVTGMIATFGASVNGQATARVTERASEGVSLALTTTQIGLVLAVPAALFERILAGRCERLLQHDLDELHEAWIPVVSERSRGAA